MNERTIIQSTRAIKGHPITSINNQVVKVFSDTIASSKRFKSDHESAGVTLKLFACYLQLTRQSINTVLELSSNSFLVKAEEFIGALSSNVFWNANEKQMARRIYIWMKILSETKKIVPSIKVPEFKASPNRIDNSYSKYRQEFEEAELCQNSIWLWKAWVVTNSKGTNSNLMLYPLYERLGRSFTESFYEVCSTYYSGRKKTSLPWVAPIVDFIQQYPNELTPEILKDSSFMDRFWREFFAFYIESGFNKKDQDEKSIAAMIYAWRGGLRKFITDHIITSGLMARGYGELPNPDKKVCHGVKTHVKRDQHGVEVHQKLLTNVPLSISDTKAMEVLATQISKDVELAETWAQREAESLWNRYQRRVRLAPNGIIRPVNVDRTDSKPYMVKSEAGHLTDRNNPQYLQNAAATFRSFGYLQCKEFKKVKGMNVCCFYPKNVILLADEMGLPTSSALYPHLIMLMCEHDEFLINPELLMNLEIFDITGEIKPLSHNGNHLILASKAGRGKHYGKVEIELSPKSAELIYQVLVITQPIREHLRKIKNDQWRWLFLSCGQGMAKPQKMQNSQMSIRGKTGSSLKEHLMQAGDTQALQMIFVEGQKAIYVPKVMQFSSVIEWASERSAILWKRCKNRHFLSAIGKTRPSNAQNRTRSIKQNTATWVTSRENPDYLQNISANFEHHGFLTEETGINVTLYPFPQAQTAYDLGLPTIGTLLPFAALLVRNHPEITPSFLDSFELYDKNGKKTGYREIDSGKFLVGYKDRKGSKLSEQKVKLNPTTDQLIQQVIQITSPLRNHLKAVGDKKWRFLFLECSYGFDGKCQSMRPYFDRKVTDVSLKQVLPNISDLTNNQIVQFADRISLSSIRASAGVLVYLETNNVEAMAKALGHAKYDHKLLKHYLPEPVFAFFQERWIRIFQQGIIAHSLRDSPLLLKATRFESMDQLDEFLSNHALKEIPAHLENPDEDIAFNFDSDLSETEKSNKIYFDINTGVLSALLSLKTAVEESDQPEKISPKASFWAGMTSYLVGHIEKSRVTEDIKNYLKQAKALSDKKVMDGLIYE